jgi:hypothetical protein
MRAQWVYGAARSAAEPVKWTERRIARAQRKSDLRAERFLRHEEAVRAGTEPPNLMGRLESSMTLSGERLSTQASFQIACANERLINPDWPSAPPQYDASLGSRKPSRPTPSASAARLLALPSNTACLPPRRARAGTRSSSPGPCGNPASPGCGRLTCCRTGPARPARNAFWRPRSPARAADRVTARSGYPSGPAHAGGRYEQAADEIAVAGSGLHNCALCVRTQRVALSAKDLTCQTTTARTPRPSPA